MALGCLSAALICSTAMLLLRLGWVYFQSSVWNPFLQRAGRVQWSICISSHSWQVILATLVGCVLLYARDESRSLCGFLSVWVEQRQLCESQKQNRLCWVKADLMIWEPGAAAGEFSLRVAVIGSIPHILHTEPVDRITILANDSILQWQLTAVLVNVSHLPLVFLSYT